MNAARRLPPAVFSPPPPRLVLSLQVVRKAAVGEEVEV